MNPTTSNQPRSPAALRLAVRFDPVERPQKIAVRQAARRDGGDAIAMWPDNFSNRPAKKFVQRNLRLLHHSRMRWLLILQMCCLFATLRAGAQTTNATSVLIEAAGQVEFLAAPSTNWQTAAVGHALLPGDRLRTRAQSRAAVQLSDRSVIRLDELTTLEILPPRNAEKKRFGLSRGKIYFFNREKPADVEFDTPLAAGAIRGTEFLLAVAADSAVNLALIDGLVSLQTTNHDEISLQRGEDLQLSPGLPPVKTALVNVPAKIQWALYYPAVVDPAELRFASDETNDLAVVLKNYRAGDLLGALAAWPAASTNGSAAQKILRAQLELAVGGVNAAENLIAGLPENPAAALRELIAVVRGGQTGELATAPSASLLLADSYALQARTDLVAARTAARRAVELAPKFGLPMRAWRNSNGPLATAAPRSRN